MSWLELIFAWLDQARELFVVSKWSSRECCIDGEQCNFWQLVVLTSKLFSVGAVPKYMSVLNEADLGGAVIEAAALWRYVSDYACQFGFSNWARVFLNEAFARFSNSVSLSA